MRALTAPVLAPVLSCALLAGGCNSTPKPPSAACSESTQAVEAALAGAPGAVRLRDGTRLSECVSHAIDQGALESVGSTLVDAASDLEMRAKTDRNMALRLGYLVGAVRRGASTTNGVGLELARRIEGAGALPGASAASLNAEHDGIVAGQRNG